MPTCRYHGLPIDHPDALCDTCMRNQDAEAALYFDENEEDDRAMDLKGGFLTERGWVCAPFWRDGSLQAKSPILRAMIASERKEQQDPDLRVSLHPVLLEVISHGKRRKFAAEWDAWVWWLHPKTAEGIPTNLDDPNLVY